MSKKYLLWKRALRSALLVLLLSVVGTGKGYANYDFYAVCETGQILYYNIIGATSVELTHPGEIGWDGFLEPYGEIILPETVQYEGTNYTVTEIGYAAFDRCAGITGSIVIPNSVTSIGSSAFDGCWYINSLTIPNSVTEIGSYAFDDCHSLTSISIPYSVTEIKPYTFSGCRSLTTISIPYSVTSIGDGAFRSCSGLTSIEIPYSVTELGVNPFQRCSGLEQIVVAPENSFYDSRENCNAIIRTSDNTLISSCKNTVIPNVTTIGAYAFSDCSDLTSITIPNSVTTIGWSAFSNCVNLTSVTIPNSAVTTIGAYAFESCSSLTSITIPNSVITINEYAFQSCSGLTSVTIGNSVTTIETGAFYCGGITSITSLATAPPYLGTDAITSVPRTLTVPCGCIPVYEASAWATHFSTIVEDCSSHNISIDNSSFSGGNVNASVNSTNLGEEVILTITPNEGMVLASLIVCNANDPSQTVPVYPISKGSYTYGFLMPPYDVVVKAAFVEGNAVGESNSIAVSVYPNPTQGHVKIEAEDLKYITISNMLGQVIYEGKACGNEFTYNFGQQGEGVYLIRIETASGVVTKRVSVTL